MAFGVRWAIFSSFNVGKPQERDSDTLLQKGKHSIKPVSTQLKSFSTFAPQGVTSGSPEHFSSWSEKCQAYTTLSAPITRLLPGSFSLLHSLGLSTKVTPLSLSPVLTHSGLNPEVKLQPACNRDAKSIHKPF